MSSDIQTTLELLVINNYLSLASIGVVVYDYILTFSRESISGYGLAQYQSDTTSPTLLQSRPWTWVSTMFVVVRYVGLCWFTTNALNGDSFVPGPLEKGTVMYQVSGWAFIVFLSVTDLVMILRVYAMWNRSRTILSILLLIYVPQNILTVVLNGIYNNPNTYLSVTLAQVLDFSSCSISFINTPSRLYVYRAAPRLVLAAVLVILAVSQTLKQSFEMYKATKQWQPNRYMQKLVGDGVLYFIVNVLYQIDYVLTSVAPPNDTVFFLSAFLYIAFYTLIPRFIISIRELYDHDIRGRFHIDTGFGVQSRSNVGPDTTMSGMVFVDGNQGPEHDLELGRVHGSVLNEDSPIGGRE
ncbi:hypothetical protein L210DRAFT_3766728 [Boletus edulis BED1]|uniref:DUF6533 domain-containing protein n=1 Tax=Boletus edulis BED1 TaxID=1328754 RepID=A0AAD4BCG3_BOLED|nr:hypothetical protein L210DRAFT_3766728 [Boletus edulis BED1]